MGRSDSKHGRSESKKGRPDSKTGRSDSKKEGLVDTSQPSYIIYTHGVYSSLFEACKKTICNILTFTLNSYSPWHVDFASDLCSIHISANILYRNRYTVSLISERGYTNMMAVTYTRQSSENLFTKKLYLTTFTSLCV